MAANVTDGTNSTFVTLPNGEPFLVKVILTPGEAGGVMVRTTFETSEDDQAYFVHF